jgi:ABC-type sugar transport system substrate-binding protein
MEVGYMRYGSHLRRTPRLTLVAAVAVLAMVMTACSSSGSSPSSSTTPSTTATTPATSASSSDPGGSLTALQSDLAKYTQAVTNYAAVQPISGGVSALKGKTVWYIPIGSAIPTLAAIGTAMQTAFGKVGITMHTCDGKLLPTDIATCLSQAATQGADGVVTAFIDYKLVPNGFNNLVAHHIPVLIAGEQPDGGKTSTSKLGFYSTRTTDDLTQKLTMESVITASNGAAKILYFGVTDSPETEQEAAYAKSFVAQNCSGCKFTEVDYNTAAISKLPSQVSASLISNPDTTYVVCETDLCAPNAVSGIKTAGYTNKVKLTSANGNLDSLQRIKAGDVQFSDAGVSSTYFGWQFADGILRMLAGSAPISTVTVVRLFNKSNVDGLALTPAAYQTNAWYGSNAYEQTFLSAWSAS